MLYHAQDAEDAPQEILKEIIAEMTAAYLRELTGIENRTIDNSAAFIASWLKMLSADRKLMVRAAAQAQRACDYVLNRMYNH